MTHTMKSKRSNLETRDIAAIDEKQDCLPSPIFVCTITAALLQNVEEMMCRSPLINALPVLRVPHSSSAVCYIAWHMIKKIYIKIIPFLFLILFSFPDKIVHKIAGEKKYMESWINRLQYKLVIITMTTHIHVRFKCSLK